MAKKKVAAPMWQRVAQDTANWLAGDTMSPRLWAMGKVLVLSTNRLMTHSKWLEPSEREEYITDMVMWYFEMVQYMARRNYKKGHELAGQPMHDLPARDPKLGEELMLLYSTRFIRDASRYLFMWQLRQSGIHFQCVGSYARCVYTGRLGRNRYMHMVKEIRDKSGQNPWKLLRTLSEESSVHSAVLTDETIARITSQSTTTEAVGVLVATT